MAQGGDRYIVLRILPDLKLGPASEEMPRPKVQLISVRITVMKVVRVREFNQQSQWQLLQQEEQEQEQEQGSKSVFGVADTLLWNVYLRIPANVDFGWTVAKWSIFVVFSHHFNGHSRIRFIGGTYHVYIYIYKAYFWRLCKGISPQNMAKKMVRTYLHVLDPGDLPLIIGWDLDLNQRYPRKSM